MRKRRQKHQSNINQYDKLVIDIKNNIITRVGDLVSKLLNTAPDKLFDMASAAKNNADHNRYFELMNQLRQLKSELADAYLDAAKKYLIPAAKYQAEGTSENNATDELSLIGTDEIEGMVLVKSIGGRATSQYREQLSHLEARLEHLGLKSSTIFDKQALSPINFCQAFDDSLQDHFDPTNKKILFNLFEAEVINKLESLYDSINNRLIDAGILPQIKLQLQKQQQRRQTDRKTLPEQKPGENEQLAPSYPEGNFAEGSYGGNIPGAANTGGDNTATAGLTDNYPAGGFNPGGYAMTAAPGGNYHYPQQQPSPTSTNGNIPTQTAGSAGGTGFGSSSGNQPTAAQSANQVGTAASGNEFQHYTAGMPASQVSQILGNFLGTPINQETLGDPTALAGSPIYPASTAQHFGHQEIIQALSGLQAQSQFVQPQQLHFDAAAIKQAVITELAKKSGGVVSKRINQIAEKTIDFIELIFDAIIDDTEISDTIKTLLLRLQIPIIKASMSDPEFFIYDDHAARILLDKIAEIGVGITDHNDEIYIQLNRIVNHILDEYDQTTETFQEALDELNKVIDKLEEMARQKEADAQQQTLRHHARKTVLKALRLVTRDKILPEVVHPLILRRWPTLMFNHYLQFGKENDEWVNMVETLRDIIESIQPLNTAEDLAILLEDKDEIITTTYDYLSKTIKSPQDIEKVIAGLKQTYETHIKAASFSAKAIDKAEEAIADMEAPVDDLREKLTRKEPIPDIPENFVPGSWFQLYMGDDQIPRRCKLSVVVPEDANLMFVNHKGELVVEKSFDELNAEIAAEQSKIIMSHSAFDHALKSVVTRLKH